MVNYWINHNIWLATFTLFLSLYVADYYTLAGKSLQNLSAVHYIYLAI